MSVQKVISGAQIGADIAALRAAKKLGLETGGWMPHGFKTKTGPEPGYAVQYGVREHSSPNYPARTEQNVFDSDGTVRFAHNFNTPGEVSTMNALVRHSRPWFDIEILLPGYIHEAAPVAFREWVELNAISTLNVAGNALSWIEPIVEDFLVQTLQ